MKILKMKYLFKVTKIKNVVPEKVQNDKDKREKNWKGSQRYQLPNLETSRRRER